MRAQKIINRLLERIVMDTGMSRRGFLGKVAKSSAVVAGSAGAIRYASHHVTGTKSEPAERAPTPDTQSPLFNALKEILDSTQEQIEKSETLKELVSALKTAGIVGGIAAIIKSMQVLSEAGKNIDRHADAVIACVNENLSDYKHRLHQKNQTTPQV